jgi:PBSX family phage terminase large subunit
MAADVYTPKQRELLRLWQHGKLRRINLLEGSVRSGKTWISLVVWAFWVATMPRDGNYLMVAKTLTSLRRNCLDLLQELVGTKYFSYSLSKKEARLFGRLVYLEGVNDARAESKIRGMTLQGAYCDELTLFTEDFFAMLLSRLSCPGAKLIATTNPDSPQHWLKVKYMDRAAELDMLIMKFLIEDNTFLDPEYVENLKKEYVGVFYDRFILGQWVVAEGRVYPMFTDNPDRFILRGTTAGMDGQFYISCDYGTINPLSLGLWCVHGKQAIRIKEYYWDSRREGHQKTDEEYYADLERLAHGYYIRRVIVDPSAASFIECIRRHGKFRVWEADNDVLNGIRVTASLLNAGMVKVHESCKNAIREFGLYRWDEKKNSDAVLKENDHAMDDIRYFCYTVLAREFRWAEWRG